MVRAMQGFCVQIIQLFILIVLICNVAIFFLEKFIFTLSPSDRSEVCVMAYILYFHFVQLFIPFRLIYNIEHDFFQIKAFLGIPHSRVSVRDSDLLFIPFSLIYLTAFI